MTNSFPAACGYYDYAVNLVVNGTSGDYMEVGALELGTGGTGHTYNIFTHLELLGGDGQHGYTTCGASLPANNGYTRFRLYRVWANGWTYQVDCTNTGSWATVSNKYIDASYTWGFPRSEFSRHADQGGFATYWSGLQYRYVNDGLWKNWPGFGCFYSPIDNHFPGVDVNHLSANSWNLVSGSGGC